MSNLQWFNIKGVLYLKESRYSHFDQGEIYPKFDDDENVVFEAFAAFGRFEQGRSRRGAFSTLEEAKESILSYKE